MFLAHFSHFSYSELMNMELGELGMWYVTAVNSYNHLNAS